MDTFVTPDTHGNHELALELLVKAGVPLDPGERRYAGVRSVHLGDLANCVAKSTREDAEALVKARDWYDVVLVGNHEYPYFDGPGFLGFWPAQDVCRELMTLKTMGILKPCLLVGKTLLTHAGVASGWGFTSSAAANESLHSAWSMGCGTRSPFFMGIGQARGGQSSFGGVLWSDWNEEDRAEFNQVHGHTPVRSGPSIRHTVRGSLHLNLDVGGGKGSDRLVGAWLDEQGKIPLVPSIDSSPYAGRGRRPAFVEATTSALVKASA